MESVITRRSKIQFAERIRVVTIIAIRWLCMALFLYTSSAKIFDHDRFLKGLSKVHLISRYSIFISYLVPATEIVIGLLLIIPKTAKQGLYSFMSTMILFTGYIIAAMFLEKQLPCRCGGAIEKLSWSQHIWLNLAFIALAVVALWLNDLNTSLKKSK
ncbi:hypothetical protein SAMN05421821_10245 [Mucilaginibacter lappiensis]|uniref:Membrane protein YphA (DoxX/SURF4 family) n=1 Tax=Mucilaginibacter lappiensis TaxID=354630 RepID=A0ABR6PIA8_9SPHI|nr:MauE/DoxX family redox-associated membrane protein [Mucilaginibacter lappiensis]MBB6108720.1 putative membrane protein YphA (DoxX/SURF4 family) [Mucilaginibacter lappiensis]SIQ26606.1 hypothetical protein SAMN05421821_10245 [Mucilaginibacter lappiensis]